MEISKVQRLSIYRLIKVELYLTIVELYSTIYISI